MKELKDPFPWVGDDETNSNPARLERERQRYSDLLTGMAKAHGLPYMLRIAAQNNEPGTLELLSELARASIEELMFLVNNSNSENVVEESFVRVLNLLVNQNAQFHIAAQNPKRQPLFKYYAMTGAVWPANIYRRKWDSDIVTKFVLNTLELGKHHGEKLTGKTGHSHEAFTARLILRRINSARSGDPQPGLTVEAARALKPFSKRTATEWWEKAKPLIEGTYGEEFYNHRQFKHWLKKTYKETVVRRVGGKVIRESGTYEYSIDKPGRLAADIKKAIQDSFLSLAP